MSAEFENGFIKIRLVSILETLTEQEKLNLIEELSCEETIIKHVSDQLLNGWTENGYYGGQLCSPPTDDIIGTALDNARRRIALGAGDVSKSEIKKLQQALIFEREQVQKYRDDYFRLYHNQSKYSPY